MHSKKMTALVGGAFALSVFCACTGGSSSTTTPAKTGGGQAATAGGGETAAAAGDGALGTATIKGVVKWTGEAAALEDIDMKANKECHALHATPVKYESLLVKDGKLANAIVSVKKGAGKYKAPAEAATLDQNGCQYKPHVMVMQTGQTLKILNSDDFSHNVHGLPEKNPEFNEIMAKKGLELEQKPKKAEIMKVKCDIHGWMSSFVGIFDHPFADVTDAAGAFELSKLPAGEYTIEAWHESGATESKKVTLKDGETQTIEFALKEQE